AQVPQTDDAAVGRRMWILLFDIASLKPDHVTALVDVTSRWLAQSVSNADLVSIVTVGTRLHVVKDFTSSREDLVAALQSPELLSEAAAGASALAASPGAETALEPFGDVRLRALATLCKTVAPIQQRKSLLYFSAGMNREADKDGTELRATTD